MIEISVKEERVEGQGKSNIIMFHLLDILYFVFPFIGWGTFGWEKKRITGKEDILAWIMRWF